MAKVHITLVGGQVEPVYNGIKWDKPDKVIFICSKQSKDDAILIGKTIGIDFVLEELPTDELLAISNKVLALKEQYKQEEIVVNISSGVKPWAVLFSLYFFTQENSKIIYCDQNHKVHNIKKMSSEQLVSGYKGILERLQEQGHELNEKDYIRLEDFTQEDAEALAKIEKLRKTNNADFNRLFVNISPKDQNKLKNGNPVAIDLSESSNSNVKCERIKEVGGKIHVFMDHQSRNGNPVEEIIESKHAIELAFNSGWFEYKVAKMLSHWDKAKEVFVNCRFRSENHQDKNEIDVLVGTEQKLLFVECKTQITNITDIDKFKSAVNNYGGKGSKGIFIVNAEVKDKAAQEKLKDNDLLYFSLNGLNEQEAQKKLFELLNEAWKVQNR